jgi:hypothetical protein
VTAAVGNDDVSITTYDELNAFNRTASRKC